MHSTFCPTILVLVIFFVLMNVHSTKVNKPFVKSIHSSDGDIVDCVLTQLQPAFDHPKLKGKLPLDPPRIPFGKKTLKGSVLKQLWNSNGESCPDGTVPIRRTNQHDNSKHIPYPVFARNLNVDTINGTGERAFGYVKADKYYGAQATINLWNPSVTNINEFSSAQVWVKTDIPNHDINTVVVGWMVNPGLYKSNSTRLFIYWTNKNQGGCIDLTCPGFIQTNKNVTLGMALTPVSIYDGEQYSFDVLIWQDKDNGNWWLKVGDNIVGYWPAELFPDLHDHATLVMFGGLVFNVQESGKHTTTQMGSGHSSYGGFQESAYMKNLQVVDRENKLHPASGLKAVADRPKCYDVRTGYIENWGNFVYFGGPGRNPDCP